MKFLTAIAALFAAVAAFPANADDSEIPAKRLPVRPPEYPTSCKPALGEPDQPQTVIVTYTVTKRGYPVDVRVRETSDECFNETAIAAVRGWRFEPRRVNGKPQQQEYLETTFKFVLEEPTEVDDFDARPLERVPPKYPVKCSRDAASTEIVVMVFDVTPEGATDNIRIIETTNECLNKPAMKSVEKWIYEPRTVDGQPVRRNDVQTSMVFMLKGGVVPLKHRARKPVAKILEKIQRILTNDEKDVQEAFAELELLEQEYGDTFNRTELIAFHQLRGAARLKAGDYAGALDDFRIVRRNGLPQPAAEAITETIAELEQIVAAQEAAAASAGEQEAPPESPGTEE